MRIEVSGRHIDLTPAIEQYARDKCERLPRYFNGVQEIRVVLDNGENNNYKAEIVVEAVKTDSIVAHAQGPDIYACVDDCVEKMARRLHDFKEKLQNHRAPKEPNS